MNFYFIILVFIFSTNICAKTVGCQFLNVSAGDTPARLKIKCGDIEGHVKGKTQLKYLNVVVRNSRTLETRVVTLKNLPSEINTVEANLPPAGHRSLRNYVPGISPLEQVLLPNAASPDMKKEGSVIYGFSEHTEIFRNQEATELIGTLSMPNVRFDNEPCYYVDDEPLLIKDSNGCHKKLCLGKIKCRFSKRGQHWVGSAVCPTNTEGRCPSASDCAADKQIKITEQDNEKENYMPNIGNEQVISE